jgi:hypothetical protein
MVLQRLQYRQLHNPLARKERRYEGHLMLKVKGQQQAEELTKVCREARMQWDD